MFLLAVAFHSKLELTNSDAALAYKRYQETAELLKDDQVLLELIGVLEFDTGVEIPHKPFVFLDGSSGMGKTQTAFNLINYYESTSSRKVLYLVCSEMSGSSQDIYSVFRLRSACFQACVDKDLNFIGSTEIDRIRVSSLYTFGFFKMWLDGAEESTTIAPRTFKDIVFDHSSPPLVILDEFLPHSPEVSSKLRFMRNVFRALKCVVLIMGTESRAYNLISAVEQSRSGKAQRWCTVFAKFPAPKFSKQDWLSLGPRGDLELLRHVVNNSRPWFARLLLQLCSESHLSYDDLFAKIGSEIIDQKALKSGLGLRGQVCLFLNKYFDGKEDHRVMVHRHFANLREQDQKVILDNKLEVEGTGQTWKLQSSFPILEKDVLLYLCLTDLPGCPAFSGKSFSTAYRQVEMDAGTKKLVNENAAQKSNDGNELEALVAGSAIVASHADGVSGTAFPRFFSKFIAHLTEAELSEKCYDIPEKLVDLRVPFSAPPNQTWPSWLVGRSGFYLGSYHRLRNMEMIDGRLEDTDNRSIMTFETKHHSSDIQLETMRDILRRLPDYSTLHIVVSETMQKRYFTGKSAWDTFVQQVPHVQDWRCLKLEQEKFVRIEGIPDIEHATKHCLFVERHPLNHKTTNKWA